MRLAAARELAGRSYSEQLIPTISEVLAETRVGLPQLQGIVVIHGPGSFTGIRIGVSAAKGLAEALAVPIIAVSRLRLLALKAQGTAIAVLDAGRGEFFVGVYQDGICVQEILLTRENLMEAMTNWKYPVLVCENRVFESLSEIGPRLVSAPAAIDALAAGANRFLAQDFDDTALLDANYLRRSEIEMLARIAEHAALRAAPSCADPRPASVSVDSAPADVHQR
ncbi:TsaB protein, required for threonylcarbamoyladenosine (t(6)A) formation in tRNA [Acidisarcina polymorpha]|uniref:TsaB protein, required for threonylcarbamoyladenosine (T(6)A) formation in tRNA n=1 Tax=Acidisarcina polymorpha TaxID=2211140 RepID=A0A2Z5G6D8_9BACT|nr:TsaB protein, required for threonylcarbamoyladenosine (t(6)A) formation in tRNA [Acidisarcina polymorpha]